MFRLLREADFRRLLFSSGLWWQGMWMEQITIGWLTLIMTDSAWWVAMIGFLRSVPLPIVGLLGSSLSERFRRRHVVIAAQLMGTIAIASATVLYWCDALSYWHLAVVAFIRGCAWALEWPVRRGLIPDLVGKGHVVDAMVLESGLQSVSRVAGPLVAGWVLSVFGAGGALGLLTAILIASISIVVRLQTDSRSPDRPQGLADSLHRVRDGFHYMRRQPSILGVLVITAVMNMWCFPYQTLLPVFARDVLSQGPMGLGLLGAAAGVGSVTGLAIVNLIRRKVGHELIFAMCSILACVGLLAFSVSQTFTLSLALLFLAGVGQAGFSVMQSSIILLKTTDEMRTRVMSTVVLAIGFGPAGQAQGGAIAEAWGAPLAVSTMALSAIVAMTVVVVLQSRPSSVGDQQTVADN